MPDPLVSVVIPAYNAEKTICNTIDSVLGQTMPNLEVIVVDDESRDGTVQAVEAVRDPRVSLLRCSKNGGPSAARNLGLKRAHGSWAAFVDADDEWVPTRLENLLAAAQPELECFVADLTEVCIPDARGRLAPLRPAALQAEGTIEDFDFSDSVELPMCVYPMVSTAALARHQIQFPEWGSGGDWAFLIARLSASRVKGKLIHRVGYLYRATGAHDSSTLRSIEEHLKVTEFLASDHDVQQATRERLRLLAVEIRKRLLVAALRERRWTKFAQYSRRNPGDLLGLPGSVLRYLQKRVQYSALGGSARVVV